jgi:hypothetical protein
MNKIIGNIKKCFNKNIKKSIFIISLVISMILTYIVNIKIDIPQNRVYTDTDGIVSLIAIFAINYGTFSLLYIRKHLQDNKEKLKRFKIITTITGLIIAFCIVLRNII